jgi:hypothetical protein
MEGNWPVRPAFRRCRGYAMPGAGSGARRVGVRSGVCWFAAGTVDAPALWNVSVYASFPNGTGCAIVLRRTSDPLERGKMTAAPTGAHRSQGARAAAERRLSSTFDRNASAPHLGTPHARAAHVPQGKSMSAMASSASTAATADDRQAEYFVWLLTQRRQRIEQRIDDHHKAVAAAEARGHAEDARRHRRMTVLAEQDRRTVADLLDKLRQRFGGVAQVPGRARRVR